MAHGRVADADGWGMEKQRTTALDLTVEELSFTGNSLCITLCFVM